MTRITLKQRGLLFTTAFIQVTFVACSTVFIAKGHTVGILASAFLLSLMWTINVKKIALSTWPDRIFYASGAAIGSLIGTYAASFLASI